MSAALAAPLEVLRTPRTDRVRGTLLVVSTVLMGLIAGFFYAYACSVMLGLARVDDRAFIASMQAINATVKNWAFASSFFGVLLVTAVAAATHWRREHRRVLVWVVAALAVYATGFAVTMWISVPLNDQLAGAGDPGTIADPAAVRAAYEDVWNRWNLLRTLTSTAALGCLVGALITHGRTGESLGRPCHLLER
jgi:uncharacterized membrane protein